MDVFINKSVTVFNVARIFLVVCGLVYVIMWTTVGNSLRYDMKTGSQLWSQYWNSSENGTRFDDRQNSSDYSSITCTKLSVDDLEPGKYSKKEQMRRALEDAVKLYIITPTFPRINQISEITRVGQSIKLARNVIWLVAEDTKYNNSILRKTLDHIGVSYIYMTARMPKKWRTKKRVPKGVSNRNKALEWILGNGQDRGVLYFADDDNTYDSELFLEIRKTKAVSVFPVGYIGNVLVDTPIVKNGRVVDFRSGWEGNRMFPIDMAGFAVNVGYLKKVAKKGGGFKAVSMAYIKRYEESLFLRKMHVSIHDLEPLAENCTKVWVWHTKTVSPKGIGKLKPIELTNVTKHTNLVEISKYRQEIGKSLWQGD